MARSTFGGFGGDQVSLDPAGNSGFYKAAANYNATGTFWSASTGGTQYTDLVDPITSVALAGVSTDAHGHVVPFKGPDGITEGWLDFGGGRFKVTAIDSGLYLTQTAGDGRYETGAAKIVYVSPSGNDTLFQGKTWSTAKATIAGALTAMGTSPGKIVLDNGTHPLAGGCAWPSNAVCGMVGQGPSNTTIAVSSQTGAGLDLSSVVFGLNGAEFGGFTIQGDGTAGSAKKGLVLGQTSSSGTRLNLHDIVVKNTGGACFDLGTQELSDFDRLVAYEPVSANANDIPYVMATGPFNGNRLNGLQLFGVSSGANVGPSGAVVIKDNGTYAPNFNHITALRTENLHIPSSGTIVAVAGNSNVVTAPLFFDTSKVSGATGTSYMRFTPPSIADQGGNLVTGTIPGKDSGSTTSPDTGIDLQQSRNAFTGVKGYKGSNITLASGVGFTYALLGGEQSGASDAAFVNNSGQTTNVLIEASQGVLQQVAGNAISATQTYIGSTSGPYWLNSSNNLYTRADLMQFQALDVTNMLTLSKTNPRVTVNGDLSLNGGKIRRNVSTKTASYSLLGTDEIVVFNGTSLTATLPDPTVTTVYSYVIKNVNASALTVQSAGTSKTLDGAASQTLAQWAKAQYVSDGTQWLSI